MKTILRSAVLAISAALLSAAVPGHAMTLGKARGGVVLGQPLNVAVAVQMGPDEEVPADCFAADVFYGDIRLTTGVDIVGLPAGKNAYNVQISTAMPVNEPVVKVQLRSTCGMKSSRQYVFLAEYVSDAESPLSVTPAKANAPKPAASLAVSAQGGDQAAAPAGAAVVSVATPPAASGKSSAKRKLPARSKVAPSDSQRAVTPAAPAASPTSAPAPSLAPAAAVATGVEGQGAVDDLKKRIEALDAWQSANQNAQDVLKDSGRLKSLESDINGLKTLAARNQQVLAAANERMQQIDAQRFSSLWVYGLMAALAMSLLGLITLWLRSKKVLQAQQSPWWSSEVHEKSAPSNGLALPVAESSSGVPSEGEPSVASEASKAQPSKSIDVDLNMGESVFNVLQAQAPARPETPVLAYGPMQTRRDFANSGLGVLRSVNTKEMLDVRQQAEFFMTLGQHDEAIKILEGFIHSSHDANPMVYLDLLKILHTLSKKTEFERYRLEFNHQFTGVVSAYGSFNDPSAPLEDYPDVCRRLTELWPTEEAVQYIEQCLVRSPEIPEHEGLELEAFRDLLMLHGSLQRMESMMDSGMVPFSAPKSVNPSTPYVSDGANAGTVSFQRSDVQPLPVLEAAETMAPVGAEPVDMIPQAVSSSAEDEMDIPLEFDVGMDLDLDLDLDLSDNNAPPENLIEFDMSGYSTPSKDAKPS